MRTHHLSNIKMPANISTLSAGSYLRLVNLPLLLSIILIMSACNTNLPPPVRETEDFGWSWIFHLGDLSSPVIAETDTNAWQMVDLPHDWSIEGKFSKDNPATYNGGALPGGIGWYRKKFTLPLSDSAKEVFIDFDGIYRNSEVWINGKYLGKRPYGYSSFRYVLTPYLQFGEQANILLVKVDNSQQPNSRWYSGSGIYRNVWLVKTGKVFVDHWGTCITTPEVTSSSATVNLATSVRNNHSEDVIVTLLTTLFDHNGKKVGFAKNQHVIPGDSLYEFAQECRVKDPALWSDKTPNLYTSVSQVMVNGKITDDEKTVFGIRNFRFDKDKGFIINGEPVKLWGVCDHHDLGALGAAVNTSALKRQLTLLKDMGCNAIRTSHNPPAPELLQLCDQMGFYVMDEAFDMWKEPKTPFDYHLDWDQWHVRDLSDMIRRDRNHPSVIMWSIGNEIPEQWSPAGDTIARELAGIVKSLDTTRPVTSANNDVSTRNHIINSGALDLVGLNYHQDAFPSLPDSFPGHLYIASETTSGLETRGVYTGSADSVYIWPNSWPPDPKKMNPDLTCSAYDICRVPWGSTHEQTLKIAKKLDFLAGIFIWTGFDYLGEPTPYQWPARSSYFGIIDLAGIPKDVYYMYQSEWTKTPVLHILPHWNWPGKEGKIIDVWIYSSFPEVELFLNGKSLGRKTKTGDDLHLAWKVPYSPGTLKAVGTAKDGSTMTTEMKTAGAPAAILLEPDRSAITADGRDLSFVTVSIVDKEGTLVPDAANLVNFSVSGQGSIAGVDNGKETSMEPFKAHYREAYNGKCVVILESTFKPGTIKLDASSAGLKPATILIETK